jgi:hypothetical protein
LIIVDTERWGVFFPAIDLTPGFDVMGFSDWALLARLIEFHS